VTLLMGGEPIDAILNNAGMENGILAMNEK
jgi:hypothetical protein